MAYACHGTTPVMEICLPRRLHTDTPSFSLFGDSPNSAPDGAGPTITWGFSKDHRPDLQQILRGLTTDQHGQVLLGAVLDGNTSDKAWTPPGWRPRTERFRTPRGKTRLTAGLGFLLLLALQYVRWMIREALRDHPPWPCPMAASSSRRPTK